MTIPTLPLVFVGWCFAILSFLALVLGVRLLQQLYRDGKMAQAELRPRLVGDFILVLVWLIGLFSSFGVLMGLAWARLGLEYFCWVLMVLTLLSGANRLVAHARTTNSASPQGRGWILAVSGVMLVALPLLVLCASSIATLRSDAVRTQFEQGRTR